MRFARNARRFVSEVTRKWCLTLRAAAAAARLVEGTRRLDSLPSLTLLPSSTLMWFLDDDVGVDDRRRRRRRRVGVWTT